MPPRAPTTSISLCYMATSSRARWDQGGINEGPRCVLFFLFLIYFTNTSCRQDTPTSTTLPATTIAPTTLAATTTATKIKTLTHQPTSRFPHQLTSRFHPPPLLPSARRGVCITLHPTPQPSQPPPRHTTHLPA